MPAPLPALTTFGKRLREARLAKGWTLAHMGELLDMGEPNTAAPRLSRYERGRSEPNIEVVEQLAKLLDLPEAYFFAASDILAEAILVIASLPAERQAKALDLLKSFATRGAD
ncbi:helix-turn-helix domain-containing protein [Lysobacter capsici]|uniref:helix-turn-helix domain-containing protein n=1 Tax=Lysobacter capsici TaxID=435897 RepID=UPI0009E91A89|nr:helix-turn-helix transcriptional regulator [Lysobacter capsici]